MCLLSALHCCFCIQLRFNFSFLFASQTIAKDLLFTAFCLSFYFIFHLFFHNSHNQYFIRSSSPSMLQSVWFLNIQFYFILNFNHLILLFFRNLCLIFNCLNFFNEFNLRQNFFIINFFYYSIKHLY